MTIKNLELGDIVLTYQKYLYKAPVKKVTNKVGVNDKLYVLLRENHSLKVLSEKNGDLNYFEDYDHIRVAKVYDINGEKMILIDGKLFFKGGFEYSERVQFADEKMNSYLKNKNISSIFKA